MDGSYAASMQVPSTVDEEEYKLPPLKDIHFQEYRRHLQPSLFFQLQIVKEMMFGFGDAIEPHPQSVEIMDNLVKDFISLLVGIFVSV